MQQIHSFDNFIATALNPAQREAVTHHNGASLVIAGAGSGKTRVITARISHLMLQRRIPASAIVALTFTNKAAHEMKQRIAQFLPPAHPLPFIGTFHAYCVRFLKKYGYTIDLPVFSILDTEDQKKIINDALKRSVLHKQITYRTALYHISNIKQQTLPIGPVPGYEQLQEIYHYYEREKRAAKCLDFDDLLIETVEILKKNPTICNEQINTIRHLLIDEYQDTNAIQHTLLNLLSLQKKQLIIDSICAVGDEDQSIYSWRGATVASMLSFSVTYPDTKIIKIEQNYRSVEPILTLANTIITHNTQRTPKKLWSEKKAYDRIRIISCNTEYQESEFIATYIEAARTTIKLSDIAILYRTHVQSRTIEELLVKLSIPYKIIGGLQFYERREIKDLIAYLRIINNPFDRNALMRILNTPTRGLGVKCEELLQTLWINEPFENIITSLQSLTTEEIGLSRTQKQSITNLIEILQSISPEDTPASALEKIISTTNYIGFIKEEYEFDDADTRIDNIYELIDAATHFGKEQGNTIDLFLKEVGLMQDAINQNTTEQDAVLLMTIHAAKGLEFHTVIICGLEEGIMPTTRALQNPNDIEEERRLLYVAITRARERLLITYARNRYTYGTMTTQLPSRFIDEMTPYNKNIQNCGYLNRSQLYAYCAQWLEIPTITMTPHNHPIIKNQHMGSFAVKKPIKTIPHHQPTPSSSPNTFSPSPLMDKKRALIEQLKHYTATTSSHSTTNNEWQTGKRVRHATYGIGTIQSTEHRGESLFLTIQFINGIKKIKSSFVQSL